MAPREHLGRLFWHLGTTLEDHGSSRMDAKLPVTGFLVVSFCFIQFVSISASNKFLWFYLRNISDSTLGEQPSTHFNISCFFPFSCHMGSSVPSFWHFGTPFSHPGSTSGNDFGTSGAPWGAILAPREHLGMPFWHLGTTLEDHGSSRIDTKLQTAGFLLILE